jgi:hypothetical protein
MYYNTRKTQLENTDSPFHLEVVQLVTHRQEKIFQEASEKSGINISTLTASWDAIASVICGHVRDGDGVTTELFSGRPSIQGGAESIDADFKKGVNTVRYRLIAGPAIVKAEQLITPYKAPSHLHGPVLTGIEDMSQKLYNSYLTSDGDFKIFGNRLTIAGTAGEVGIEIVRNGERLFLLGADDLIVNKPSLLIGRMPEMTDGPIELSVITAYAPGGKKLLKTPHKTTFEGELRIGEAPAPVADAEEPATDE